MPIQTYLAYLAACIVIIIVPGPTVTLIIANSLRHGSRAGLANVAGTQLGIALMIGIVAVGLAPLVAAVGWVFDAIRLVGAAYLVWLGLKLFRSSGALGAAGGALPPRGGFFLQGLLVAVSNPKTLIFFGAFIPQFIDPGRPYLPQVAILGATCLAVAALSDGAYAVLVGRAGALLSQRRIRLLSRVSGSFLIGGGVWLALSRSR
jgi:threonine/homoserine/homoserine lactone efflux protein